MIEETGTATVTAPASTCNPVGQSVNTGRRYPTDAACSLREFLEACDRVVEAVTAPDPARLGSRFVTPNPDQVGLFLDDGSVYLLTVEVIR